MTPVQTVPTQVDSEPESSDNRAAEKTRDAGYHGCHEPAVVLVVGPGMVVVVGPGIVVVVVPAGAFAVAERVAGAGQAR